MRAHKLTRATLLWKYTIFKIVPSLRDILAIPENIQTKLLKNNKIHQCWRVHIKYLSCALPCAHLVIYWKMVVFSKVAVFRKTELEKVYARSTETAPGKNFFKNELCCAWAPSMRSLSFQEKNAWKERGCLDRSRNRTAFVFGDAGIYIIFSFCFQ